MKTEDLALEYFRNNFNCSQAVFTAFGTRYGIGENECLKIGCAFGAGMGRQQFTCGAVTGALMSLGLKYGKGLNDPDGNKSDTYLKTREFFSEFINMNGSAVCRILLNNLDINDPEDHKKIMEQGLFEKNCEKYVADAVRITEAIMK